MLLRLGSVLLVAWMLAGCGPVEAEDVPLANQQPSPCATTEQQALADDLGATYSDSPGEAAEVFARDSGQESVPASGWVAYDRQDGDVLLSASDWRVKAARNPDRGWLVVEWHRCA
jgi:hypothetical protein